MVPLAALNSLSPIRDGPEAIQTNAPGLEMRSPRSGSDQRPKGRRRAQNRELTYPPARTFS